MKQPIFIAHRGAWLAGRRENTTGAIERATKSGRFAYIEFDVRRSRSDDLARQTPILMHDKTLDRLYDLYKIPKSKRHREGQLISGLTIDIIRAEEIEVATLADAMRAANGHPINIELKTFHAIESVLEVVGDMIKKYDEWSWEKVVFSSFKRSHLYEVKQKAPEASLAMLYGFKNLRHSFGRDYHTLGARWIGFNKWLAPFLSPLAALLNVKHRAAYAVNNKLSVRLLSLLGVEIFFTDSISLPDTFTPQLKK